MTYNVFCIIKNHDWEKPNLIDGLSQSGHNVVGHYDWGLERSKGKIYRGINNALDEYFSWPAHSIDL